MPDEFSADPTREWDVSLSQRHEKLDRELDEMLDTFSEGGGVNPVAVVGPYGAGKTQYLYEVCRRGWTKGLPALYTDLKTILDAHESSEQPITSWLEEKIEEETDKIISGDDSEWLPEFRTTERKNEFYESFIDQSDTVADKRILLIDEVEQKYEKLDDYLGVDDENPLRDILDGLTDVFQVWSFGLVSAYELIGEADRRRFTEARIPITEPSTVWTQLNENNRPTTLTNGVWWLARGRAGWISNHSSDLPDIDEWGEDEFLQWFSEVSSHSYYGADAIASVWADAGVPAENLTDAKRTVLFEEPLYEDWVIRGNPTIIPVSKAHSTILNAIRENQSLNRDVIDVISNNLQNVLEGLSPPSGWLYEDDELETMFLPSSAFSREEHMEGLINTVSDFISSFEKRGDTRKDATQILSDVSIPNLTNTWANLYDPLEKVSDYDLEVWTVNPEVIREAYPPLALNPGELTAASTEDLRKENSEPIEFDPDISFTGGGLRVWLCPTDTALQSVFDQLSAKSDVTETTVILCPDSDDYFTAQTPNFVEGLIGHKLVTLEKVGGKRLWDFILQLDNYLQVQNHSGVLGAELIEDTVIPQTGDDQKRNTINALFADLERIGNQTARSAKTSFTSAFTLEESGGLIWQDSDLDNRLPYYGTSSSSDSPKHGLEYGLVFAERTIDRNVPHQQLISNLEQAYNQNFAPDTNWFRSVYFFNRVFEGNNEGIHERVRNVRSKYMTEDGKLRRPVLRLQRALSFLSDLNNEGPQEVYERLAHINKDTYSEEKELAVLTGISTDKSQTEDLFRGLLLEWALKQDINLFLDDLEDLQNELSRLDSRIDDVTEQIEFLNKKLQPPSDFVDIENIRIQESNITSYRENLQNVYEGLSELAGEVEDHPQLAAAVVVLWSVTDRYKDVMQGVIEGFQDHLGEIDLYSNVNELKDEYSSLRTWVNSTSLLEQTQVDQSELQSIIDELGRIIFDYPTRLNSSEVPVERAELLGNLDEIVHSDLKQLSQMNKRTNQIERRANHAENNADAVKDLLFELAELTSGGQA
ncbi:hypothetical protein [Haloarchaeobius iranensis]|nr:hypothetical protein [Haloarchaeobius iranensis]